MVSDGSRRARIGLACCTAVLVSLAASACDFGAAPTPIYVIKTAVPSPTATATPEVTAEPTPTPVPVAATITSTMVSSGGSDKCGTWTANFKKPVVSGVDSAATIQAAIDQKVTAMVDAFKSQLPSGGTAGPCTFEATYVIHANTPSLLGMQFKVTAYMGGANSTALAASLNFRVATGAQIGLKQLFSDLPGALNVLSTRSRALLPHVREMEGVGTDWINPGTTPMLANFDMAWAISTSGLVITFKELQVGPVACGTPTVTVPWSYLKTVVDPAGPVAGFAH